MQDIAHTLYLLKCPDRHVIVCHVSTTPALRVKTEVEQRKLVEGLPSYLSMSEHQLMLLFLMQCVPALV